MEDASNSEHSNSSDEWADLTNSEYAKVIFHHLSWDVELGSLQCTFSLTESVTKSPCDRIGLFKVGFENLSQCLVFKSLSEMESENIKFINCCFKAEELPELNGFYQFCYITQDQEICGASMPIEVKHLKCKIFSTNDVITEGVEDDFLMVRHGLEKWNLELQTTVKTKEEENQILRTKIQSLNNEKAENIRQLESLIQKIEFDFMKNKQENAILKSNLNVRNTQLANVSQELVVLAETLKTVEDEKSKLELKVESITIERDNFAASLACIFEDYGGLNADIVKERDMCELPVERNLKNFFTKLEALTKEKDDLVEKLIKAKEELNRYKCENVALKIQCEEYLISDWSSKFKAKEEELNDAKSMLKAVEESKRLAIDEIKKLKEKVDKVENIYPGIFDDHQKFTLIASEKGGDLVESSDATVGTRQNETEKEFFDGEYAKMPQSLSRAVSYESLCSSESDDESDSEREIILKATVLKEQLKALTREIKLNSQKVKKVSEKELLKEQLKYCQSILKKLFAQRRYVWPFFQPVDAKSLQLSNDHEVIKHPMDLGTIEKKLAINGYKSPDEFASDVRLVFTNCYRYNSPGDSIVTMARKVQTVFEMEYAKMPIDLMLTSSHLSIDISSSESESDNCEIVVDENKPLTQPIHLKKKKADRVKSLKLEAKEWESKYEAESAKLVTMSAQIEDFKDRFVKTTSELNALKEQLEKCKDENLIKEKEIAVLNKKVTDLNNTMYCEKEKRKMEKSSLKKDAQIASLENHIQTLQNHCRILSQDLNDKTARLKDASEVYKSLYVEKALLSKKLKKIMKNKSLDVKCDVPVVQSSQSGSLAISCEESTSNNSDSDTGERVRSPTTVHLQGLKSALDVASEVKSFTGAKPKKLKQSISNSDEKTYDACGTETVVNEKAAQDKNPLQVENSKSKVESLKEVESTIQCSMCEALFAASPLSNTPMLKHYEIEHNMDMCPLCGELFDRSLPRQYLQFHVDNHFLST